MRKAKRILTAVLGMISLSSFAFAAGCVETDPLTVDKTPSGDSGLVFEYMTDCEIPIDVFSGITQGDVDDGKVTFVLTSPEHEEKGESVQDVYNSKFPAVYCNVVGEWRVTYVYGKKHDTKTFEVRDTIKPEFEVASRAYDVWFDATIDENGQISDKGTRYSLPMIFPEDLSEFDYDTMVQTLTLQTNGDGKTIEVTILPGDKYYAPAVGKMTYTIGIADIHGNYNSHTVSWNVKDPTWKDGDLKDGYLADYDEEGYINTVYSGNMSAYWIGSEITESYLTKEEFEEETGVAAKSGVVKVMAAPTDGYAVGAFGFRLSESLTQKDIEGKSLIVKFYTPNDVSTIRFGCKTWQTNGNPSRNVEAVHSVLINVEPGQWNYAVISEAMLNYGYFELGDDVIDEFQIAFGEVNKSIQEDEIILYVDEVALAEKLPDITGFEINGNVISWDKVEGADAYEVTEDGKTVTVTDNSYEATDPDGVITVRATAESVRYISADYATTFINTANFGEYDLALFDSDSYESIVTKSTRLHRVAKSVEASVLDSYEGATNVLKVVTTAKEGGIADFRIKLPKECSDGITVRFMIKSSPANFFYWMNPSNTAEDVSISDDANILVNEELGDMAGKWQVVYIPYANSTTIKDVIEVLILDNINGAEGGVTEVYFDEILSGDRRGDLKMKEFRAALDALAADLPEGYLADFSSKGYEAIAMTDTWGGHHVAKSVTAEYVSDFKGYTDLLKVTTENNESTFGNFTLYLPEAMTEGGYTVRFYLETTSTAALRIGKPHTEIAPGTGDIIKEYYPLSLVNGVWTEVYVPYDGEYTNEITFQIWGGTDGVNTFYFDYVADGDVVDKMASERAQAIVDALPEGYLADFSSELYESMVVNSKYSADLVAASLKAEYTSAFDGATDLIKITTVNNEVGSCFGGFAIDLPKSIPTESGFTVRFYIESTGSSVLRIINPASDSARVSDAHEWAFEALDGIVGKWMTVYVPYSETYKDTDTVEFMFFWDKTSGTSGTNVIYIDSIVAGNRTT